LLRIDMRDKPVSAEIGHQHHLAAARLPFLAELRIDQPQAVEILASPRPIGVDRATAGKLAVPAPRARRLAERRDLHDLQHSEQSPQLRGCCASVEF
jgi:hypothetical protein